MLVILPSIIDPAKFLKLSGKTDIKESVALLISLAVFCRDA
ncbi:MAG: hypothetical protein DQL93_0160 (endogenous virus) [Lactobacillus phage ViSo-2018b]|nr:MAG: hypothetical protein DQL93_0160 [Lactobacillus phage ViSo-2018b]